jgi:hypothetical protein
MTTALARRFKVDVSNDGTTWLPFKGINDLNPPVSPTLVAADDYDSNGWNSYEKTMQSWLLTINGAPEAFKGQAIVGWAPSKTGVADLDEVTVTLTGDGILSPITNPYNVSTVPVITSISPSGKGAGGAVAIYGSGFTGLVPTTGVKVNAVNATSFDFQNDGLIIMVLPAGSAGTTPVVVTTAAGASIAYNYTRIV